MVPTAAAVAALEPEIAAKNAHVIMATIARPPEICPNKLLQRFTRRFEIPRHSSDYLLTQRMVLPTM